MKVNFDKSIDGLVPAIIQDAGTHKVLMLGYMNQTALKKTVDSRKVTFYSRSKKRLWTKGEESGNYLKLVSVTPDCDADTLLIKAIPAGPVCHTGADTCWNEENKGDYGFLSQLERVIDKRKTEADYKKSYVASLFEKGINKIAQKTGEEAIELIIEAKDNNDELFKNEAADLLFHYLILLNAKHVGLNEVLELLERRHES